MPTRIDGLRDGRFQAARLGSFGHAPGVTLAPDGITLAATIWPTAPQNDRQGLIELTQNRWRFALAIDDRGCAVAQGIASDGTTVRAATDVPLLRRYWYDVAARLDPTGRLSVVLRPRACYVPMHREVHAETGGGVLPADGVAGIQLAALSDPDARPNCYYNGKLERPTVWSGAMPLEAALQRQCGTVPHAGTPALLACWDFSHGIPGNIASDVGPQAAHARLINLPTRGMTGANWTGAVHDWKLAPEQYGAIHFHDDDQGDLGWTETAALDVPAEWPSGFYAAHIMNGAAEDYIPFFVRSPHPSAAVAFLVPSFTYQVYGNFIRPGRGAEIRERVTAWGALRETPDMNPEFGLSAYNHHSDRSGVSIISMLRPMLDTRPKQMALMDPEPNGSGTGRICADSYFIHWLHRIGVTHDVITDHDLHAEGTACLTPYRVIIAGQHPEYHSLRMMQALEDYLGGGGRLMYLGGNGFYWRAEPSQAEPHALEVRRSEGGIRTWATEAGENYHAFGGGYGGLWRRIGKPAHRLVGNGFSSQGRHLGFSYRFTDAICDPRIAFMTEGLEVSPGQELGDKGYMGGGAAGFELDSVDTDFGTPPHALVLAKGVVIHPDYGPVNEDMLVIRHPKPQEDWSCADMLFFATPAGGAVFSVGSMTFAGSLPVEDCNSTLGRLTTNVLRRFLDPTPFT